MAHRIDPDNEADVRNFLMDFRAIVHQSKGRGIVLVVNVNEEKEPPVQIKRVRANASAEAMVSG